MVHVDAESLRGKEDVYQWYTAEIGSIPPAMRELMEKHSGLAPDKVVPHISDVVRICSQLMSLEARPLTTSSVSCG